MADVKMTDVKMADVKTTDNQVVGFKTNKKACNLQAEFQNIYLSKMDHFKENDNFYALILLYFDSGAK